MRFLSGLVTFAMVPAMATYREGGGRPGNDLLLTGGGPMGAVRRGLLQAAAP